MKTKTVILASTAILFILLLALPTLLVSTTANASSSTYPSTTCYASNWGLNVQAPTPNEVVTTSTLAISVHGINYQVDARYAGTPDLPGIGHYHEYLDNYVPESEWNQFLTSTGMPLTPLGNQPMPAVGAGIIDLAPTTDQSHDKIEMMAVSNTGMPPAGPQNGMTNTPWPGLSYGTPGLHYLTLVPACNDHSVDWAAAVNIPFIYAGFYIPETTYTGSAGSPTITITSPSNNAVLTGTYFYLSISTTNFQMCGGCYAKPTPMPNEQNIGHWHVFALPGYNVMPGDVMPGVFSGMPAMFMAMQPHMLTMSFSPTSQQVYTLGLASSPGWYTFYAVLVQNNHMPLTVPATMNGMTVGIMLQPGTFAMANYYVSPLS